MCGRFGTIKMLIPNSLGEQLMNSIGNLNTNINEKVDICNITILNILSNIIPHEFAVCDDKDPPWFNKKIRALIQGKNVAIKNYRNNSNLGLDKFAMIN